MTNGSLTEYGDGATSWISVCVYLEGEQKKSRVQKLAISKKSTIFALFLWKFVKMINSSVNHFDQVS